MRFMIVMTTLLLCATLAAGTPILDQSQLDTGTGIILADIGGSMVDTNLGQSYTAGADGILTSVHLSLSTDDSSIENTATDAVLRVWSMSGGALDGLLAEATQSVTLSASSAWHGFDLSALDIMQVTGQQYAIGITIPTAALFTAYGTDYDAYNGGSFLFLPNDTAGAGWFIAATDPDQDLAFQTYVESTPIPEPATVLLLATGLSGLALARRRRRRGDARAA